jgi:acyl carrier protein
VRTRARIRRFVRERAVLGGEEPTDDPLRDGLLDSLALEALILFLEETFEVRIEDEDTVEENFESIDAVVALVEAKRVPS